MKQIEQILEPVLSKHFSVCCMCVSFCLSIFLIFIGSLFVRIHMYDIVCAL